MSKRAATNRQEYQSPEQTPRHVATKRTPKAIRSPQLYRNYCSHLTFHRERAVDLLSKQLGILALGIFALFGARPSHHESRQRLQPQTATAAVCADR